MIGTLNAYWGERGAVIMQPYHTELGAGTSNPATFLRVLGPEPRVARGVRRARDPARPTGATARTRTASSTTSSTR